MLGIVPLARVLVVRLGISKLCFAFYPSMRDDELNDFWLPLKSLLRFLSTEELNRPPVFILVFFQEEAPPPRYGVSMPCKILCNY